MTGKSRVLRAIELLDVRPGSMADYVIGMYADEIMVMIGRDIKSGVVPASVASFTELHDYVDANEYTLATGLLPEEGADDPFAVINRVEAEVDRRLAALGEGT